MNLQKLFKVADNYSQSWEVLRLVRHLREEAEGWLAVHGRLIKLRRSLGESKVIGSSWPYRVGLAHIKMWFVPTVENVENKRVFLELTEHLTDYLRYYYASRTMHFVTKLLMIPENIPDTTEIVVEQKSGETLV